MGELLAKRIKQSSFSSPHHEAMLNIIVAAEHINSLLETRCRDYGITLTQYNVLRILKGAFPDGHPRFNIIDRMLHHAPDVTRLIDRLVSGGFARRGRSVDDKRQSLTYITTNGLNLLSRMQKNIDEVEREIRRRISIPDAQVICRLCERLYED